MGKDFERPADTLLLGIETEAVQICLLSFELPMDSLQEVLSKFTVIIAQKRHFWQIVIASCIHIVCEIAPVARVGVYIRVYGASRNCAR